MIYGAGDSPRPSAGAAECRTGGNKQTDPQPRAIDTSADQPVAGHPRRTFPSASAEVGAQKAILRAGEDIGTVAVKDGDLRTHSAGFVLGLPRPPSVNRFTNRLGNQSVIVQRWVRECDHMIMAMRLKPSGIRGPFQIEIMWDRADLGRFDIDNRIKPLLDYLQRIELIEDDKLCHHMVVKWGPASLGCIVRVEPAR